ncbi:hypothetical protein GB928_004985 [Shinella curvata]|uniref:Uncharacterized protein n=1 Tax=Shinella curvata TaxID=1817964 RepID=A0ABT8X9Z0_9HYPH|nr:hypothetical protein [Shinella curvata]MCJ8055070.1 hypothetical protein [Shinella curvata]MDO6120534.1 hypothetical protein [Shinella curvata]
MATETRSTAFKRKPKLSGRQAGSTPTLAGEAIFPALVRLRQSRSSMEACPVGFCVP